MSHEGREFISEPLVPDPESFVPGAAGEPLLAQRFTWRERAFEIVAIERRWKTTDAAHSASGGGGYVRRHWADVRTACGERLRIYGERGGRPRWFVHSRAR